MKNLVFQMKNQVKNPVFQIKNFQILGFLLIDKNRDDVINIWKYFTWTYI